MRASIQHVKHLCVVGLSLMGLLTASGCAIYDYPVEYAYVAEEPIDVAPPAPIQEDVPVQPFVGAVWVPGYWYWNAVQFSWIRGCWVRPPIAGVLWRPGRYFRRGNRYVRVRGAWVRRGPRGGYGRPYYAPGYRGYVGPGFGQPRYWRRPGYGHPPRRTRRSNNRGWR